MPKKTDKKPFKKVVKAVQKDLRKAKMDIKKKTTRREDVNQAAARILREATHD